MPIRINLKELFPADSQEITVDKINFNFNKLLALGIGDEGQQGISGVQGAAGPVGIIGPTGSRGSTWFVDAGNPTLHTFTDLLEGDLYLDSTLLAIWQWDGTAWNLVANIDTIINNYLASSPSPFVRGLGIGSPNDDRFILFNRRSNTLADSLLDTNPGAAGGNTANNDILFLNNFNEDVISPFDYGPIYPTGSGTNIGTVDLYNSLLAISIDQRQTQLGRYHFDLGALYDDAGTPKLTTLTDNFKARFVRESSSTHVGQTHWHRMLFSMDRYESEAISARTTNGVFEFSYPKYLTSAEVDDLSVFMGSRYGLDEITGNSGEVNFDGILFSNSYGTFINGGIGLAKQFDINAGAFPDETGYVTNRFGPSDVGDYLMLESFGATDAVLINDELYQDGGNLIQLASSEPREVSVSNKFNRVSPSSYLGHMGIAAVGNRLVTLSGKPNVTTSNDGFGYLGYHNIENPNNVISETITASSNAFPGAVVAGAPVADPCCGVANDDQLAGPGASDIAIVGKNAFVVNSQSLYNTATVVNYNRVNFQSLLLREPPCDQYDVFEKLDRINTSSSPAIDCAYRVQIKGGYAIVATNALHIGALPSNLGGSNAQTGYDGRVVAVNISDPTDISVTTFATNTKTITGGTVRSAMIDLEVIENTAYTLTWEQEVVNTGNPTRVRVHVDFFDLSQLESGSPTVSWKGTSTETFFDSTPVDAAAYSSLVKRGAITGNRKYIFAGYGDQIKVFNTSHRNTICANRRIKQRASAQLNFGTIASPQYYPNDCQILDMKQLGNSLYVLAIRTDLSPAVSYLFKFDVSGGLTNDRDTTFLDPVQIYVKEVTNGGTAIGSRMEIVGKHIYIATHNTTTSATTPNAPHVIAVDFDGFYTGGAHIESLRSEQAHVTKDLVVGDSLTVGGPVTISGGLSILGPVVGLLPAGMVVPFAGPTAPAGWLLCDGSSVSSTNYLTLHSVISNEYGGSAYTGATGLNFSLPNLKQRIPVGRDPGYSQGADPINYDLDNLGHTGGSRAHTLTVAQIPKHKHTATGDGADINITSSGSHTHNYEDSTVSFNPPFQSSGPPSGWKRIDQTRTTTSSNHTHSNSDFDGSTGDGTTDGLAGAAHTNMQPYIVMNYIIYTGA